MILFSPEQWAQLHDPERRWCTIRRGVRKVLPGPNLGTCNGHYAVIHVTEVITKRFEDLTHIDAIADGYDTLFKLRQSLADKYPGLGAGDIMTIIHIGKVQFTV